MFFLYYKNSHILYVQISYIDLQLQLAGRSGGHQAWFLLFEAAIAKEFKPKVHLLLTILKSPHNKVIVFGLEMNFA